MSCYTDLMSNENVEDSMGEYLKNNNAWKVIDYETKLDQSQQQPQ